MSVLTRPTASGRAVVLRVWPTGETSVVGAVLTESDGLIKLVAKGARAQNSRLRALVQPGRLVEIEYSLDPARELQYLRGGSVALDPLVSGARLETSAYLQAALEIVERGRPAQGRESGLFALCHDYVRVLSCAGAGREAALFYAFEIALLDLHGVRPHLEACVHCGRDRVVDGDGPFWLSPAAGGLVCAGCTDAANLAGARPLTAASLAVWPDLAAVPRTWPDLALARAVARDWGVILHRFLEYHLPAYRLPSALDLLRVDRQAARSESDRRDS